MIRAVANAQKYFQAPRNYFWRWADNGEVIEWRNGSTICYRDDLITILKELKTSVFPPAGTLLLILSACQKEMNMEEQSFLVKSLKTFEDGSIGKLFDDALRFLEIISKLPIELRSGSQRAHLIYEIFNNSDWVASNGQLKEVADELNSGRLDALITLEGEEITKDDFGKDLLYLSLALQRFHTVQDLELELKTSIDNIPEPAKITTPSTSTSDLFDQLAQDPTTLGISRLAKRLIAALNIPMHSQGTGDQSYGGISDISNRGNYDKLLISELAHDDMLLMARLVNNEALYFRRELPPESPKRQRTILLDITLRMWGIPRLFGLSAALACVHHSKHDELIEAYALGGEQYKEINLYTREGIIQSLEILHHSLHCGNALQTVINELPVSKQNDFFFITDSKTLSNPDFHVSLSAVSASLSFIISVSRDGELLFYECIKGKTKLLSTAKFDLYELLFPAVPDPEKKISLEENPSIAFLSMHHAPLFYPRIRIKKEPGRIFFQKDFGAVIVNETQRVLYISKKDKGAEELLNYIEKGSYFFGFNGIADFYVLVSNLQRKLLKFYKIDVVTFKANSIDLSEEILPPKEVIFKDNRFYLRNEFACVLFDCIENRIIDKRDYKGFAGIFDHKPAIDIAFLDLGDRPLTPYLENYDNIFYKIRDIYINEEGKMALGSQLLSLVDTRHIKLIDNPRKIPGSKYAKETTVSYNMVDNKHIKFSARIWDDGSEAVIDSRGLLHLRSADMKIPEITIVLVLNRTTACWASDGTVCGSGYFINEKKSTVIPAAEFYRKYIQRFIDRLI